MKILLIGSGGREHAIAKSILKNKAVEKLYIAPGNGGLSDCGECVDIGVCDKEKLLKFAKDKNIDLVVVGPENPLVDGIVDFFNENNIRVFGPNKEASRLEGSKIYMKDFLKKYNIPTARYEAYDNYMDAKEGLKTFKAPYVIKTNGLAAGKGVLIPTTYEEAVEGLDKLMKDKLFGNAGDKVIIESFLEGVEMSLLCFVDGEHIYPMESAKDYKRALDGDEGLNTGGMGCFSPHPYMTPDYKKIVEETILKPTMDGLIKENLNFKGVLFIGLMCTDNGPKVLEYNVRFGDPETEVVLPRLNSDLVQIMNACIDGKLDKVDIAWKEESAVTVICASGGYPEKYEKGIEIKGLSNSLNNSFVYHAGTKKEGDIYLTNGGRVLAVTALGDNIENARKLAYKRVNEISFDKMFYRKDIAKGF